MGTASQGSGMIQRARENTLRLMNFHNQGVVRADFGSAGGPGFTVEFLGSKAQGQIEAAVKDGAVRIVESAIAAVIATSDQIKQKLRSYLDAHFSGSAMHGNAHRRISNAMVQSVTYESVNGQPGFTSLIYSKLGKGKGPANFVDFLLLHMHGGTLKPNQGEWLRLDDDDANPGGLAKVGNYGTSKVFFVPSEDGQKLFLLRKTKASGATQLLATLVKSIRFPASLSGIEGIAAEREVLFERNFDAAWQRGATTAGAQ